MSFFNYHEYEEYNPYNPSTPIIVTHFPNPYPSSNQDATRIVRIPRLTTEDYPKFSFELPGHEEGATKDITSDFQPLYELNDQWFGISSISPLSNHLTPTEFSEIITKINKYFEKQYTLNRLGMIYMILNTLSFGLINGILNTEKSDLLELENYIDALNKSFEKNGKSITIINPRLSGYISLDFQIPKPIPN